MPSAAAVNCALEGIERAEVLIDRRRDLTVVGLSPPSGERFFQKIEWFV